MGIRTIRRALRRGAAAPKRRPVKKFQLNLFLQVIGLPTTRPRSRSPDPPGGPPAPPIPPWLKRGLEVGVVLIHIAAILLFLHELGA